MNLSSGGLKLKLVFWFYFISVGSWMPFYGIYYKTVLVNPDGSPALNLIGIALAITPFLGIFANTFIGILADKFLIKKHLLFFCALFCALSMVLISLPGTAVGREWDLLHRSFIINLGLFFYGFSVAPIVPLINAETLDWLHRPGRDPKDFGVYRVWGSISWIVITVLTGILIFFSRNVGHAVIVVTGGYTILALISSSGIKGEVRVVKIPWKKLKKDHLFLHLLIFGFLQSLGLLTSYDLTSYYLDDLKLNFFFIGLAFSVSAIPEIPLMFVSRKIINRLGCEAMILIGTFLLMLKTFLLFLVIPLSLGKGGAGSVSFSQAMPVLLVMLIHGFGFALQFNGFMEFINLRAHKKMRAIYMTIFSIFTTGLAKTVGGPLSSWMISVLGSRGMMGMNSGIVLIGILYFFIFIFRKRISP